MLTDFAIQDYFTLKVQSQRKNMAPLPLLLPDTSRTGVGVSQPVVYFTMSVSPPENRNGLPGDLELSLKTLPTSGTFSRTLIDRIGTNLSPLIKPSLVLNGKFVQLLHSSQTKRLLTRSKEL